MMDTWPLLPKTYKSGRANNLSVSSLAPPSFSFLFLFLLLFSTRSFLSSFALVNLSELNLASQPFHFIGELPLGGTRMLSQERPRLTILTRYQLFERAPSQSYPPRGIFTWAFPQPPLLFPQNIPFSQIKMVQILPLVGAAALFAQTAFGAAGEYLLLHFRDTTPVALPG
jgi:hypothetical protein